MSSCGVSQLFSTDKGDCPGECPFWAPSSVWKFIGVCSEAENCSLYNPILNYSDTINNVCLPCKVFGCVSCKYSDIRDSMINITDYLKTLPDYCIKCAKGYKRSSDGKMCYLVNSKVWSKILILTFLLVLLSIAILTGRLALDKSRLRFNFQNMISGLKNQQKKMLRNHSEPGNPLYSILTDLSKNNVSGVGLMLYFRNLVFLTLVMSLLFFASLAHVHIPCSKMIRIFKEPFRIYYLMRSNEVPKGFIKNFFTKNVNKLVDDIFNFKSVDEAIQWNVVQYSNEVSGVMHVLYISIMIMTVVYLVSQKRTIKSYVSGSSKVKDLTLVIKNLPISVTSEHEVSTMIENSTGITPGSVTICYDLKERKTLIEDLLDTEKDLMDQQDSYVNLDRLEDLSRSIENLKTSGECFITFENINDVKMVLKNFKTGHFEVVNCNVEPENVLWENVGHENRINEKIFAISVITVCLLIAHSVIFFVPYAFYNISSPMTHIFEILLVSVFVECGNILVSIVLSNLINRAGIINKEIVEGYLMFCNYFIKLLNLGLNIILSHLINYGGRSKILSIFNRNLHWKTPSFRVGEELSFGLSFSIYMINVLILIPNALFLVVYYLLPIFNSLFVLVMDFDLKKSCKFLEYSTFRLSDAYSDDLSNITCCLFLMFLIKDRKQGSLVFFSLCISYFLNYLKYHFIVLRRSSKKYYSSFKLSYFSYIMWIFPTLILSICPSYWDWRSGEGTLIQIFSSGLIHILLYIIIIYLIFGPLTKSESNLTLEEALANKPPKGFEQELDYNYYNPINKLRKLVQQYNVL